MTRTPIRGRTPILATLCAALALTAKASGAAETPGSVPETWRRYAETLVHDVQSLIETANSPAALELRRALPSTRDPGVTVKIWADPDGAITRVEAGPGTPAALGPDLQGLLIGRRLPEAPPRALAWPIRVRLEGMPDA